MAEMHRICAVHGQAQIRQFIATSGHSAAHQTSRAGGGDLTNSISNPARLSAFRNLEAFRAPQTPKKL
jgi:hypothetical protein